MCQSVYEILLEHELEKNSHNLPSSLRKQFTEF
jgi:hypothetical protein